MNETKKDAPEAQALIKKLSAKIIMEGTKIGTKLLYESGRQELDLFRISGIASDTKAGESDYGQFIAFLGDFQSVNLIDGTILRAAKCYLPKLIEEMLLGKLAAVGEGAHGVIFSFVVGIKADESSSVGYVYYAKPVIQPGAEDPMEKLLASLPAPKVKALPAPAKKEAKA